MATPIERRAIQVLPEEYVNKPPEGLNSAAVYKRLTNVGLDVPDYALLRLWEKLQRNDLIAGRQALGGTEEDVRRHGNWYIQWVHPELIEASAAGGL